MEIAYRGVPEKMLAAEPNESSVVKLKQTRGKKPPPQEVSIKVFSLVTPYLCSKL